MAWSHSRLQHQIASSSLSSLQHRWVDARKENLITALNLELVQQWELGNDLAVFQVCLHCLLSNFLSVSTFTSLKTGTRKGGRLLMSIRNREQQSNHIF
jgi:hypothetical protein